MLKYKERIIDGRGMAEKIKGELKERIIARQLSKSLITRGGWVGGCPCLSSCFFISYE